jgi:hypothetical protein
MLGRILLGGKRGKILLAVYLGVGLIVAGTHGYLDELGDIKSILSAILAVVLWPLVLIGLKVVIK